MRHRRPGQSGQALVEYVMLLMLVAALFVALRNKLISSRLMAGLTSPLQPKFSNAYRYGHVEGDAKHPRKPNSAGNVRLFYVKNPN